jgi:hypothetical protein
MAWAVYGQQGKSGKLELIHADSTVYIQSSGADPAGMKIFYGHISFKQESIIFKCDTATLYVDKNILIGHGHIEIIKNDTVRYSGQAFTNYGNSDAIVVDDKLIGRK